MRTREQLAMVAEQGKQDMVDFCRRLVRTPSPSGHEQAVAALIASEMETLGYDEIVVDGAGNVIGVLEGDGIGATVQFNTHMDHVDAGNPAMWPHPPFDGTVSDGYVWGRGASDVKGAIACQVHALAAIKRVGLPLAGRIEVTCVVQEEIGGIGTKYLARGRRPDYAVIGEATSNRLAYAHRGSTYVTARWKGKSVHSSRPWDAINPHYSAAGFLLGLRAVEMFSDPILGQSSLAPTLYTLDNTSPNVTPGRADLTLNFRNVPSDTVEELLRRLGALQERTLEAGCIGECFVPPREVQTYTGFADADPQCFPPLLTPADHPLVSTSVQALEEAYGRPIQPFVWAFATDGGHLAEVGVPCVGFGPMEEKLAHTIDDRVSIHMLEEGYAGYMALGLALTRLPAEHMW
jgi:succinyl-diaminopimelate desuccinylase